MQLIRNDKLQTNELNELLKTQNWGIEPSERLQNALNLSWGWICARNEDNELIGFVQILSDGIKHAYILRLLVHPDYRGRGIGKKLMLDLLDWLDQEKLNPILITKPDEEPFYSKFGLSSQNGGFISLFRWK
jgi:aralkylamine N-acetyltransferase